ncbi:pentatricopeptide repeat-containing protein [Quercus suber]|uniref:Pentatricopeptide repeat-containing protein n=1 Tax=Quercus suber TaxID=58331 RepID=A0AAW0KXS2_QUESU
MITRQLNFKVLHAKPRTNSLKNFHSLKHGHHMFDQIPQPNAASTNRSMLNCLRKNLPFQALDIFKKHLQLGFVDNVDHVTVALALKACHGDPKPGCQIHGFAVSSGLVSYITVSNSLMNMYCKSGQFAKALCIFENLIDPDIVSWNTVLSGFQKSEDALSFALRMNLNGVVFDPVSYTTILAFCSDDEVSACGQERNLDFGKQMHGLIMKTGYGRHVSVCNVLMSLYSKCEVVEDAKLVFQIMNDRNVVSWTTIISVNEEDAVSLFNEMRLDGVYPNDVTFIGLIHAISIQTLVKEGQMIHGFCIKTSFLSEPNVCNSLITMYAKFEAIQDSLKIFEELNYREIISWNALISGYAQNGLSQEALCTFLSAIMESKPNEYTFGSVLSAIGAAEDISLKQGQRCHSYLIKLRLDTDPIVSGALLDMYAKRGNICESQKVFCEMPERTQFAWTAIISAYARHGDYDSVIKFFKEMEREGVRPDSITFLSVLTVCGRKGMVDVGRQLFDSMVKEYQIEPSPEHYSCMVDMLGRAGRLEEAEDLVSQIPGLPGLSVLQSLLGACKIHGNMEMGERTADALMEMEPTESGSYVLMSNLYAEKGHWEKVVKQFGSIFAARG